MTSQNYYNTEREIGMFGFGKKKVETVIEPVEEKTGFFIRLKQGLKRQGMGLQAGLTGFFSVKKR
jgi:hypothetical protein